MTTSYRSLATESDLQTAVIDLMHVHGWAVAHFRAARTGSGSWRTPVEADGAGFFDLVAVRTGRLLFVELKSSRGRMSPQQVWWHQLAKGVQRTALGAVEVHVWRPEDWDEIEEVLQ